MSTYSFNEGASWSTPFELSGAEEDARGPWPAVAPNGDVFVAWVRYVDSDPTLKPIPEELYIDAARSTDGGQSFSNVNSPATAKAVPRHWFTSNNICYRPALQPHIRIDVFPQIAVGPDGVVHVVYAYDPDGLGPDNESYGDMCDVFYRRSTDSGNSWDAEVRLNDDATLNDQWFPSMSVSPQNVIVTAWYDRREDDNNMLLEYYSRVSLDGGVTWGPNILVSDQQVQIAPYETDYWCYHGDYDQQAQQGITAHVLWSDERLGDGNVYWDSIDLGLILVDGFESGDTSKWSVVVP